MTCGVVNVHVSAVLKSELSYAFVIGATLFDCRRVQWQQIAPGSEVRNL